MSLSDDDKHWIEKQIGLLETSLLLELRRMTNARVASDSAALKALVTSLQESEANAEASFKAVSDRLDTYE
jgi:hypothetical protein